MKIQILKIAGSLTLIAMLLTSVLFTGWQPTRLAQAQDAPTTALPRTITVVGEGKVSIRPDVARANIGVDVLKNSVKEASAENKTVLDAVLAALKEQGIAEKDIQTSGYSIYAERYGNEGPLPENKVNYRVSNNVSVIIRDLDKVGAVLDAAVEAGANNIYGIEFILSDASKAKAEARKQAIANAKEKATELAGLTDVKVGAVVSVSEIVGNMGGYYSAGVAELARAQGGGGTPVVPGETEVAVQLQVVYAIGE